MGVGCQLDAGGHCEKWDPIFCNVRFSLSGKGSDLPFTETLSDDARLSESAGSKMLLRIRVGGVQFRIW